MLKWTCFGCAVFIAIFHLASAMTGYSLYRDIHLGTALEYAKGSINLLKPVIVGFNLNGMPTPQELPVWQAVTALAFKIFGPWFGWGNVVSLLFMFSCLYPLFRLAEKFGGPEGAWWTLICFLMQPLIVVYSGMGSPDGMSLAAAVWFMFYATKVWEEPQWKWAALAGLTGAWAAVSKLPFFMAAGLGCLFMTLAGFRDRKKVWVWLGFAAVFIVAAFFCWTRYQSHVFALAEKPFVDLAVTNGDSTYWYFGDLKYRLLPGVWIKGGWRILNGLFGSYALVSVLFLGLFWKPGSKLARWWLLGAVVTTLIFTHLVLHHAHYYLMFIPPVALICGQTIARLEALLAPGARLQAKFIILIMIALGLAAIQGVIGFHTIYYFDKYPRAMAGLIRENTKPTDKIVMQGGGWGGQLFFLSHRRGLSVWDSKLLEDKKNYARLKELGFTKLVMVSESPLLRALQHSSITSAGVDRETFRRNVTPIVATLPTILETEDILIKDLP
jgi:hypothetical protein